jgi:acyl carrier protein phosphodiesterase
MHIFLRRAMFAPAVDIMARLRPEQKSVRTCYDDTVMRHSNSFIRLFCDHFLADEHSAAALAFPHSVIMLADGHADAALAVDTSAIKIASRRRIHR